MVVSGVFIGPQGGWFRVGSFGGDFVGAPSGGLRGGLTRRGGCRYPSAGRLSGTAPAKVPQGSFVGVLGVMAFSGWPR